MTKNRETVSVLLPTHNSELTILDTLKSVFAQTYQVSEIIAVVDASTDNTLEILKSISKNSDVLYPTNKTTAELTELKIIETKFGSPSLARNAAIDMAQGDFICFLDADDTWAENKTSLQIRCLLDTKYDIVCSQWTASPDRLSTLSTDQNISIDIITHDDLLVLNRFQTSTVMMRRSCLKEAGYFAAEFDGAEDWEFWIRSAETSDIARINTELVYYRDNVNGYSKNLKRHYLASKKIIEKELLTAIPGKPKAAKKFIYANCPGTNTKEKLKVAEVKAWHYSRFVIAFLLIKEYKNSFLAFGDLLKNTRPTAVLPAIRKLLYPFLKYRLTKRTESHTPAPKEKLP